MYFLVSYLLETHCGFFFFFFIRKWKVSEQDAQCIRGDLKSSFGSLKIDIYLLVDDVNTK